MGNDIVILGFVGGGTFGVMLGGHVLGAIIGASIGLMVGVALAESEKRHKIWQEKFDREANRIYLVFNPKDIKGNESTRIEASNKAPFLVRKIDGLIEITEVLE